MVRANLSTLPAYSTCINRMFNLLNLFIRVVAIAGCLINFRGSRFFYLQSKCRKTPKCSLYLF